MPGPITRSKEKNEANMSEGDPNASGEQTDMQKLLQEFKNNQKGNNEIKTKLDNLELLVNLNTEGIKQHLDDYRTDHEKVNQSLDTITARTDGLEAKMDALTATLEEVMQENAEQRKRIFELEKTGKRFHMLEEETLRKNLLIDGIPEGPFHTTKKSVIDILSTLGVNADSTTISNIHRIGKRNDKQKRPRTVVIKLHSILTKQDMFKSISKLKDSDKWSKISISDDLNEANRDIQRDMRSIVTAAKLKGVKAQLKGTAVVIDGKRYTSSELKDLPHGLSLDTAKLVDVEDGLAFQGEHAYPSNLFKCPIIYKGKPYSSAEQLIQVMRATKRGNKQLARKLRDTDNPYDIMRMVAVLDDQDEWVGDGPGIIKEAITLKFDQNPLLKQKLLQTKGFLYEATLNVPWGCGMLIAQSAQINQHNAKGENRFGKILAEYRDEELAKLNQTT